MIFISTEIIWNGNGRLFWNYLERQWPLFLVVLISHRTWRKQQNWIMLPWAALPKSPGYWAAVLARCISLSFSRMNSVFGNFWSIQEYFERRLGWLTLRNCTRFYRERGCIQTARHHSENWIVRQTCDSKFVSLNPCRNGGGIFFSRVNFVSYSVSFPPPCYHSCT